MESNRQAESDRPEIEVLSTDRDETFHWMSVGWYDWKNRGRPLAEHLMRRAKAAIEASTNVPDAIHKLETAGFKVTRRAK